MLDRLTGGRAAEPVRVLADASEPMGLGGRTRAAKYTSLVALNRFVDALPPESESARRLELAARTGKPADLEFLRERFSLWASNDARFERVAAENPLVTELRPLSKDLSELGAMGVRVVDYLRGGRKASASWIAQQKRELVRMQKGKAEVVLAGGRAVGVLLERLSGK